MLCNNFEPQTEDSYETYVTLYPNNFKLKTTVSVIFPRKQVGYRQSRCQAKFLTSEISDLLLFVSYFATLT